LRVIANQRKGPWRQGMPYKHPGSLYSVHERLASLQL
jgi:hypothetical protein